MPSTRRARARFSEATAVAVDGSVGVLLRFRPERSRLDVEAIEDFADLGPALTIPAVQGLGVVLRLLRAARIAPPREPLALVGQAERAASLLERAVGTAVRLELRPRFRLRFIAWTEHGVETVDDVDEVRELEDAYMVMRRGGRFPRRFERSSVVRQQTECDRWYEVLNVERVS